MERNATDSQVESRFVYEDDGSYVEHCEATVAEMAPLQDSIFYTVKIDRESYAEVTRG